MIESLDMKEVHYIKASAINNRSFLVIDNIAFYQSTGESAGEALKGTWLPCLGFPAKNNPYGILCDAKITKAHQVVVDGKSVTGVCPESWIIKIIFLNHDKQIPPDIERILDAALISAYPKDQSKSSKEKEEFDIDNFKERMSYIKAAIISAKLGGGIWESEFGKALLAKLDTLYPDLSLKEPYTLGREFMVFEPIPRAYSVVNKALTSRGASFKKDLMTITQASPSQAALKSTYHSFHKALPKKDISLEASPPDNRLWKK